MLLLTGLFNFILSKRKNPDPPKQPNDTTLFSICVSESEETKTTYSFTRIISNKIRSLLPNFSSMNRHFVSSQDTLGSDYPAKSPIYRPLSKADDQIIERQNDNEVDEYDMELEETTSDKAPIIQ